MNRGSVPSTCIRGILDAIEIDDLDVAYTIAYEMKFWFEDGGDISVAGAEGVTPKLIDNLIQLITDAGEWREKQSS